MKNNLKIGLYIGLTILSLLLFIIGGLLFVKQSNITTSLWSTILISVASSLLAGVITACLIDLAILLKNKREIENERKLFFDSNAIRIINLALQAIKFSNNTFIPAIRVKSQDEIFIDLLKRKIDEIEKANNVYNQDEDIAIRSQLEGKIAYLNDSLGKNIDILIRSKNIKNMFSEHELECLKNASWTSEQIKTAPTATAIIVGVNQLLCVTLIHINEVSKIMNMTIQQIDDSNKIVDIP